MTIPRDWVTPLAAGAFLLSAATGVLIFFHIDSGLNKVAHEWLSWVLLAGVAFHVAANFAGFKRHLAARRGQWLMGLFALVLALSFFAPGERDEPPFAAPVRALAQAPLATLADVARISPDELRARLAKAGVPAATERQNLNELVGPDLRRQTQVMAALFGKDQGEP
ncbi:MAG: DUF4405 domain-containing protein [Thiobacillus sp.]|nr:DUF4405 domain-containing protein [Thiobacillus sp.]